MNDGMFYILSVISKWAQFVAVREPQTQHSLNYFIYSPFCRNILLNVRCILLQSCS
jgi:hypothetical protein